MGPLVRNKRYWPCAEIEEAFDTFPHSHNISRSAGSAFSRSPFKINSSFVRPMNRWTFFTQEVFIWSPYSCSEYGPNNEMSRVHNGCVGGDSGCWQTLWMTLDLQSDHALTPLLFFASLLCVHHYWCIVQTDDYRKHTTCLFIWPV